MEPCTQSTSAFQFCYIQLPPSILKQREASSTKVIYSIWSAPTFLLIYVLYRKSWHATLPDHPELGRFMESLITDCSKYLKILTSLKSFKSGRRWTQIQVCTASERHSTVGTPQRVAVCGWSTHREGNEDVQGMINTHDTCEGGIKHGTRKENSGPVHCIKKSWFTHLVLAPNWSRTEGLCRWWVQHIHWGRIQLGVKEKDEIECYDLNCSTNISPQLPLPDAPRHYPASNDQQSKHWQLQVLLCCQHPEREQSESPRHCKVLQWLTLNLNLQCPCTDL